MISGLTPEQRLAASRVRLAAALQEPLWLMLLQRVLNQWTRRQLLLCHVPIATTIDDAHHQQHHRHLDEHADHRGQCCT